MTSGLEVLDGCVGVPCGSESSEERRSRVAIFLEYHSTYRLSS